VSFSSGNKALTRNLYWFKKYSVRKILAKFFEDKLQREKRGNVINEDLENMQHQPKA